MHPHLTDTFACLDASRAALKSAVDTVPVSLRQQRPAANRWSAVEILEHLVLVERRFTQMLEPKIGGAIEDGLGPETQARAPLPSTIGQAVGDRSNARTAPDPVQPTGTLDEPQAWAALEAARQSLRALLSRGDGLALSTVVHAHPFFGPLTAYQWGELIAGHEMRHAHQMRELAGQLATSA